MKYSIATDKWTTIKDLGIGGNRLDFNVKDGTAIIQNQVQYIINPTTGFILTTRTITGIEKGRRSSFR
jgi:hypothetical protein